LLFASDGSPVVITKGLGGVSYLYQATRALEPNTAAGVPLQVVGTFHPTATLPANDIGRLGELLVTGAAITSDRHRVALRTYTAAYEFDVPDGDVVKAISKGTPRITPLPDEPQGEGIAYTVDGQDFLTASDQTGPSEIRRYRPTPAPPPSATPSAFASVSIGNGFIDRYGKVLATIWGAALMAAVLWLAFYRPPADDEPEATESEGVRP
jgi:hypothetical protein